MPTQAYSLVGGFKKKDCTSSFSKSHAHFCSLPKNGITLACINIVDMRGMMDLFCVLTFQELFREVFAVENMLKIGRKWGAETHLWILSRCTFSRLFHVYPQFAHIPNIRGSYQLKGSFTHIGKYSKYGSMGALKKLGIMAILPPGQLWLILSL